MLEPSAGQTLIIGITYIVLGSAAIGLGVLLLRWAFDIPTIIRRLTEIRDRLPPPAT